MGGLDPSSRAAVLAALRLHQHAVAKCLSDQQIGSPHGGCPLRMPRRPLLVVATELGDVRPLVISLVVRVALAPLGMALKDAVSVARVVTVVDLTAAVAASRL